MSSVIYFIMVALIGITSIAALYFWYKLGTFKAMSQHAVRSYQEQMQTVQDLKSRNNQLRYDCKRSEASLNKKHLQYEKMHERWQSDQEKIASLPNLSNEEIEKQKLQIIHLEEQVDVLTKQLRLTSEELSQASEKAEVGNKNKIDSQKLEQFKKRFLNSEKQLKETSKELQNFKHVYRNIDPKTFLTLKKKCSQYSRLYKGMKSLKEMNEEKNQNLEVAVRHLTTWVLKDTKETPKSKIEELPLGELLVDAFKVTGGQLIKDEHSEVSEIQKNSSELKAKNPEKKQVDSPTQ